MQSFTKPMLLPFLFLSDNAARYPKLHIVSIIVFSIGILMTGVFTNFKEAADDGIWTPKSSRTLEHGRWINGESDFPSSPRGEMIIVHRDGKNLFGNDEDDTSLALQSIQKLFEALDQFRETPRYQELCQFSDYIDFYTNEKNCEIVGASGFWKDSTETFEAEATSNEAVLAAMSKDVYPYGGDVSLDQIIGFNRLDDAGILEYGKSFVTMIQLPPQDDGVDNGVFSEEFELDALNRMLELQDLWDADGSHDYKVEIYMERSFEDEFTRAITAGT